MKKLITVALSLMFVVCLSYTVIAGSLDSPGAPSAGSGMYTLQNLYDYLTSGTALTVQSSFQEPTSGPTAGTMKTTKEIGDAVATPFALCATTTADNVELGKPFFCTVPGSWGVQTGTLVVPPTPTPTPTITPTNTPTNTPIPTPTPNPTQCAVNQGYWAPLGGGLTGYGCWFISTDGESCTGTCIRNGNWTCDPRNWNDNSSCTIMGLLGTRGCAACWSEDTGYSIPAPNITVDSYASKQCAYRHPNYEQDCDMISPAPPNTDVNWGYRICVCVP